MVAVVVGRWWWWRYGGGGGREEERRDGSGTGGEGREGTYLSAIRYLHMGHSVCDLCRIASSTQLTEYMRACDF